MKVSKCLPKQEAAPVQKEYDLTYDQILLKEGVYCPDSTGQRDIRIIVFRGAAEDPAVLWYHQGTLVTASAGWAKYMYKEVKNAEVCFEIREPK